MKRLKKILNVSPEIRIGQKIWNQMNKYGYWESPEANSLFFMDDVELMRVLEIQDTSPESVYRNSGDYGEFCETMLKNGYTSDDAVDMWLEFSSKYKEGRGV